MGKGSSEYPPSVVLFAVNANLPLIITHSARLVKRFCKKLNRHNIGVFPAPTGYS